MFDVRFERMRFSRRQVTRFVSLLFLISLSGAAACTESFEGGGACPSLCPERSNTFRDTVLDAVVLDTSLRGFPAGNLNGLLLLANRGDTLQTSAVIRYDAVARIFRPNNTGDTTAITELDSVWIRLPLDTTGNRGSTPVEVQAFNVDTTASDSVTAVVQSLFREDRLLGSATVIPQSAGDSLRIPLDAEKLLALVQEKQRVRVGLRIVGNGQLRIIAFVVNTATAALSFDPATDTIYSPIVTLPSTALPSGTLEQQLSYTVYPIIDRATPAAASSVLQIGGYPASRTYLQFVLPRAFIDSATIVRAELLLTQVPTPLSRANDTTYVDALVPTTSSVVTDLARVLDLAAAGSFVGLDSTRVLPGASGPLTINVLNLVRNWRFLPASVPRALGLRISKEGSTASEVRFLSIEASDPAQRPKLRITYLPRAEFALP